MKEMDRIFCELRSKKYESNTKYEDKLNFEPYLCIICKKNYVPYSGDSCKDVVIKQHEYNKSMEV